MLSIHIHRDAVKVARYHEDHLVKGAVVDYYTQGERVAATWFGKGTKRLGLEGKPVEAVHFERLAKNLHPITGKPLTPRQKKDARAGYDLTFSAPKSISIMGLVMGDRRVILAHSKAVAAVLAHIEAFAMARVRKNGVSEDRVTGNFVGAQFQHFTSRENDPQLHDHCVIFNATFDEAEDRWKALQAVEFFSQSGLATEIYRSALCAELHAIGYRTEARGKGVEIVGVPHDVTDLFSKRKKKIDAIAKALGHSSNPELRETIARTSRKEKDRTVSIYTLESSWIDQLSKAQHATLKAVKDAATGPVVLPKVDMKDAIDWAARHLFERKTVVRLADLAKAVLVHARGYFTIKEVEADILASTDKFLIHGKQISTPDALAAERELIACVDDGLGTQPPLNPRFEPESSLSEEQMIAVESLLTCTDKTAALCGPAGARKTSTLKELVRGIRAGGSNVTLLAPTGNAAEILRADGFVGSPTLQRFLKDREAQQDAAGGVVVLDEAGLASVPQLLEFARLAEKQDFRIILVGDSRQHKSVEAGDALRILETHSKLHSASLTTISRQLNEPYREAVSALKDGESKKGFDLLNKQGRVLEIDDEERYQKLASDYTAVVVAGQSALAVAATWREAEFVTTEVRASLREAGHVHGEDQIFSALAPLHLTRAEGELSHRFAPDQVLVFQRKSTLFERNEHVTVLGQQGGFLRVARGNGEVLVFDPAKHSKNFQAFKPREIALAPGDHLLLRANGQDAEGRKLVNGQLVQIKSIAGERVTLVDGRVLPKEFRHYSHGYCITSQASQGKTVDHVFLAIDAASAFSAMTQETLYVGASRGRHSCTVYTDGKAELRDSLKRSAARTAAVELAAELANYEHHHQTRDQEPTTEIALPTPGLMAPRPGPHPHDHPAQSRGGTPALDGAAHSHQGRGSREGAGRNARTPDRPTRIRRGSPGDFFPSRTCSRSPSLPGF